MKKPVGCWFAFAGDALAIVESVGFWREANPGCGVAVFDDQLHQLPEAALDEMRPDMVERTTWDRGGNLNGWDAVLGILDCMDRACISLDSPGAVKVDCDTLTRLDGWLDMSRPHVGADLGTMPLASGHSYWVRRDAIGAALQSFLAPERRLFRERVMEDFTISAELLRLFPDSKIYLRGLETRAAGYDFQGGFERFRDLPIVTFGNRARIKDCKGCEKRERVALAMAKYRRWLSTH